MTPTATNDTRATLRRHLRRAAAHLRRAADLCRSLGLPDAANECEVVGEVVARRLARLKTSRPRRHAFTAADHSLNAVA